MGDYEEMISRIEDKLAAGFKCIKLKIASIDWSKEIGMIEFIRQRYDSDKIEIRVDANGGFTMDNALARLRHLADLDVHSIEQPIKAGESSTHEIPVRCLPIPIALDEELIGKFTPESKAETLDSIKPAYIVIKPSLEGGFSGAGEWIRLADRKKHRLVDNIFSGIKYRTERALSMGRHFESEASAGTRYGSIIHKQYPVTYIYGRRETEI